MDRAQPGAIDSIVRNDELAQVLGQFSDGWIVPGDEPTPAARRREDVDHEALDAFNLTHSATSLDVTVEPGEAFVDGWVLRDEPTHIPLDPDSTTEIVVGWNPDAIFDGKVDANRDEADEAIVDLADDVDDDHPTTVVWQVTTDSTGVSDTTDERLLGPAVDVDTVDADTVDAETVDANDVDAETVSVEDSVTVPEANEGDPAEQRQIAVSPEGELLVATPTED